MMKRNATRRSSAHQQSSRPVASCQQTRVYLPLHLNDMTDEEIKSAYISEEDTTRIQADVIETVKVMMHESAGSAATPTAVFNDRCVRGLEDFQSQEHRNTRKEAKEAVIDAVMDEQEGQFDQGILDEARVAKASKSSSEDEDGIALERAASDAAFAANSHVESVEVEERVFQQTTRRAPATTSRSRPSSPTVPPCDDAPESPKTRPPAHMFSRLTS